jgi:hypothetical protein
LTIVEPNSPDLRGRQWASLPMYMTERSLNEPPPRCDSSAIRLRVRSTAVLAYEGEDL